jgi:hypothetical protein
VLAQPLPDQGLAALRASVARQVPFNSRARSPRAGRKADLPLRTKSSLSTFPGLQFEKSVIVAKLRAARLRKRRATGRCEGAKAVRDETGRGGRDRSDAPAPPQAAGGQRLSFDAIAARLNAEGVATRTGRAWAGATVYGVLKRRGC